MKSSIFIPKTINVGFQKRCDTYTGKLAYVIYTDEKGVLRKEKSWNSWREKDIEPGVFENKPMEGFVLNKKVGDYGGWNHRQAYTRVYDPRGFEFEITIENLLYILENANSIKGKGLEGEFIYGWDGKELVLMPVESPDYKEILKFNEIVHNNTSIKAKDLIVGATYMSKDNVEYTYMGKYDYHGYRKSGKHFWFCCKSKYTWRNKEYSFETYKTVPKNKFIEVIDENCNVNYSDMFEELEQNECYSPIDNSKDKYKEYTKEEVLEKLKSWSSCFYISIDDNYESCEIRTENYNDFDDNIKLTRRIDYVSHYGHRDWKYVTLFEGNIDDLLKEYKLYKKQVFLENGRLYRGE